MVCLGWLLVGLGLFQVLAHQTWYLPAGFPIPVIPESWLVTAGFFLLGVTWKMSARLPALGDLSSTQARPWFFLILAVGVWTRFYRLEDPVGLFWMDQSFTIREVKSIFLHHNFWLLNEFGGRSNFLSFFMAVVWLVMPGVKAFIVFRTTTAILDLAALWMFYLLGKEISSRRLGLYLMGMGAVGRQLITKCYWGMDYPALPFATALMLIILIRTVRKPCWRYYIAWGVLASFGMYVSLAGRLWAPFFVLSVGLWVLNRGFESKWINKTGFALWLMISFLWCFSFLHANNMILPRGSLLHAPYLELTAIFSLALFLLCYKAARDAKSDSRGKLIVWWVAGSLIAFALFLPQATHRLFAVRINGLVIMDSQYFKEHPIRAMVDKLSDLVAFLFGSRGDRECCGSAVEPFFDFQAALCVVGGLSFAIFRPTRFRIWLLLLACLSAVPWVITEGPHSGRLYIIMVPLLILAVMVIEETRKIFFYAFPSRKAGFLWALVLLGLGTYTLKANMADSWEWMQEYWGEMVVARQIWRVPEGTRVYIACSDHITTMTMDQLCEGEDVTRLGTHNVIDLEPQQAVPPVCVFVNGENPMAMERLKRDYPKGSWEGVWYNDQANLKVPFLWKFSLEPDQISDRPDKALFYRRLNPGGWERIFYSGDFSVGGGIVWARDHVDRYREAFPPDVPDVSAGRFLGDWVVPEDGLFEFKVESSNYFFLKIDGKTVLSHNPHGGFGSTRETLRLEHGSHQVEVLVFYRFSKETPTLSIQEVGRGYHADW